MIKTCYREQMKEGQFLPETRRRAKSGVLIRLFVQYDARSIREEKKLKLRLLVELPKLDGHVSVRNDRWVDRRAKQRLVPQSNQLPKKKVHSTIHQTSATLLHFYHSFVSPLKGTLVGFIVVYKWVRSRASAVATRMWTPLT